MVQTVVTLRVDLRAWLAVFLLAETRPLREAANHVFAVLMPHASPTLYATPPQIAENR